MRFARLHNPWRRWPVALFLCLGLWLQACGGPPPTAVSGVEATLRPPTATATALPSPMAEAAQPDQVPQADEGTAADEVTPVVTAASDGPVSLLPTVTATPLPAATPTPAPTALPTETPIPQVEAAAGGLVIDHRSVALFEQIPDEYIRAAAELRLLLRHASVGQNISDGLDCLMNNFSRRPNHCDRGLAPGEVIYDGKYDRSNWVFELHSPPPSANPGWWNKVNYFVARINNLAPGEHFDVAGYTVGYVDGYPGSAIDDRFFVVDPDDEFPDVGDLEALEAAHPEITFVWWTMGLARLSYEESQNYNRQLRAYARSHGKVLMDLADIESHLPDGTPCFDNQGLGIEAICQAYTNERNAGHLNPVGRLRLAKAMWVLMARLAGWPGP